MMKSRLLGLLLACGVILGGLSSACAAIDVSTPAVDPTSTSQGFSQSFTVSGTFSDTAFGAFHTATVDWGDGTAPDSATIDETGLTYFFSGSHTYAGNGAWSVTVTVMNDNPDSGTSAGTDVTVSNVVPTVDAPNVSPTTVNAGLPENFSISGTFADPGDSADEPYTAVIDWGDGSSTEIINASSGGGPYSYSYSNGHTYTAPGTYGVFVTVTDNDGATGTSSTTSVTVDPPTISIESAVTVSESDGNAVFTVTQSATTSVDTNFQYSTANGTATAGDDYTGATNENATITAGTTSTTISIPITDDNDVETSEDFTVTLNSADNATIASGQETGTATITDNDVLPVVEFSAADYATGEAGTVTITVTRSGNVAAGSTVNYATSNDTATSPDDYAATNGTLTFAPNETSQTFDVTINPDALYEGNEQFNLALSLPVGATLGPQSTATGTITDDDPAPSFTIDDVTHLEGNSGTTPYLFTVTKTGSTAVDAKVDYATADGTATQPSDYTVIPTTTLTFAPGDTTKQFTVLVNGDTTTEPDETLTVQLSNPVDATIADPSGLGTIENDDCTPPPPNMVSWWPGQGNANDLAGPNNGTLVNGATATATGKVGQAFNLDGVNHGIEIPDSSTFDMTDFTVDAWIKTTNAGSGRRRIISQQATSPAQYWAMMLVDNQLAVCTVPSNGVSEVNCLAFGPTLNDNAFHHVAVTRQAGVAMNWYVDGVNVHTGALTNTSGFAIAAKVYIGKLDPLIETQFSVNESFQGTIDEVQLFNRALSGTDVANIYNAGSFGKMPHEQAAI